MVAYGGLALSAFVYVPFGAQLMRIVQSFVSDKVDGPSLEGKLFRIDHSGSGGEHVIQGLKGERLKNQVFAYLVTNQVINLGVEVVLPLVKKGIQEFRSGRGKETMVGGPAGMSSKMKKKRVEWEDEKTASGMSDDDRAFLDDIRTEVTLPEYQLFGDYSEMITQFGYVVLWSPCWPLAPLMALLNNWLELRSDAFKIASLGRRPIPSRTDTIGAWLESLSFITWLGALTNAALVFLFNPHTGTFASSTSHSLNANQSTNQFNATNAAAFPSSSEEPKIPLTSNDGLYATATPIMMTALLVALASSHAYLFFRAGVRHVLERALWRGSKEEEMVESAEREVKDAWLGEHPVSSSSVEMRDGENGNGGDGAAVTFWVDQGLGLIESASKTL